MKETKALAVIVDTPPWESYGLKPIVCKTGHKPTLHKYDGYQTLMGTKMWKQYTCLECQGTFAHNFTPEHTYMKNSMRMMKEARR